MKYISVLFFTLLVYACALPSLASAQVLTPVSWNTSTVSLTADDFYIDVINTDGSIDRYNTRNALVSVHSDPGNSTYTTLEAIWTTSPNQGEKEMRLFIYFKANSSSWWAYEMRTYDGTLPYPDWIYYYGTFFRMSLSDTFTNIAVPGYTIQSSVASNGKQSRIYFKNLRLQAFKNAVFPTIATVQMNVPASLPVNGKSVGISALAYDVQNNPIWSGVTYEWGISSTGSIGIINPTNRDISNFTPLNSGIGDIYVTARNGTQSVTSSRKITVNPPPLLGDLNDDGRVNLSDLSALLSHFGKSNRNRSQGDVNGDNLVGLQDLTALLSSFGKSAPIAGAACRRYDLSLTQENSSVQTSGYGTVSALLNPVANTLSYSVSYTGLTSNEIMAHIHGFAGVGQTAGILHTLPAGTTKTGTWQFQESQEQNILGGLAYFNIHSENYPGGELRAQVQGGFPADCH